LTYGEARRGVNYRLARILIVAFFSTAGLTGFSLLLVHDPTAGLELHEPGMDGRPPSLGIAAKVRIGEYFRAADGRPSAVRASWPRFRGPFQDNTSREAVPLASSFGPGGPPLLWSVEVGEGHAGPAVAGGRVYLLDYDETRQADALRCLSLDDGREIWRRWYTVRLKRNHGISRTVPAVNERFAVSIGPGCQVMCVEAESGELRWGLDLVERFGAEVPLWYTGQCPLIDGGQAVLAPGGTTLLAGVDLATGQVLWETPNPRGWRMSHSSIMVMSLGGVRTYVYAAIGGIVGVSAETRDRGRLLWQSTEFGATVIAPSPVDAGEGRIFQTAGYGAGSILLEVTASGESFAVRTLYRHRPAQGFACEQQTPVLFGGRLFGIMPKDGGSLRSELVCWDPAGRLVWSSGQTHRFGLGPYLLADGKLLILNEDGVLTVAEASVEGFRPLASAKILEGPDAWAPMALVEGRLLARDTRRLVCVDLRRKG
jgi:outer membrane protein assembly factor BamB